MDELYFAKAFDQSPVGMVFLKGDGTVISANPALVTMLGKDLWLIVGARLDDHLLEADKPAWQSFFEAFRRSPGAEHVFESAYVNPAHADAWWSLRLSDLELEWGGEPTYFAVLQDVTSQRAAEHRLREARFVAEGANRAKSDFLANMSHEIRTPLFTITGMTDLLRLGELKRDQAHHAGQIASAAGHLLELVNDVLDFSKIEAGQMSLESIPLDLDEVLSRSLEVVSLQAYRKGIELILDRDPRVPHRWLGDPSRLRQILVNLLGNAVKFTPRGRVTLVVEPGPVFRVIDTGIGIPESARDSLFRAFTQADSSTTRQYGGTGLGLAISQKLVGLLGGNIELTSKEGEGTQFTFSVMMPSLDGPQLVVPRVGKGRCVLVVDDDMGVRAVLERRLTEAGFNVHLAVDRTTAQMTLGATRIDLVLIDQELGLEDGWQLASEIRSDERTSGLPLVLMGLMRKSLEPSPRYPADLFRCFVDKPINTRVLIETLSRGLEGHWNSSPPAASLSLLSRALLARSSDRLTILVAEDHEVNRELFRLLLRHLGHQVLLVENGAEACEVALNQRPQLVFMDLQMPVLNGYQAAQELRSRGLTCPIVAVTASAVKGELERCRDAGMDGILTKPFNLETLDAVVRSYALRPAGTSAADRALPAEPLGEPETAGVVPPFDRDEALRTFLGNQELLDRLVERFRVQTRLSLETLDRAAKTHDLEALRSGAHALKGSASNLSARALATAAEALETAAGEGRLEPLAALMEQVHAQFEAFEAFLN